jgi:hypothetical protein
MVAVDNFMEFILDVGVNAVYSRGGPNIAEFAIADGLYVFILQDILEKLLVTTITDETLRMAVDQLLLQPLTVSLMESLFGLMFKRGGANIGTLLMKNLPVFAISGAVQYIVAKV